MAAGAAVALGLLGHPVAACGVWIGVGLSVMNLWLMYEIARSLLTARTRRGGGAMAIGSSLGRLLLLGTLLAVVGVYLGREALLGACGGLLLAQLNLTLPARRPTEAI